MTLQELSKETILDTLTEFTGDSLQTQFRAALIADPRNNFAVAASPAKQLRSTLEVKHRIARTRGKTILGGDDLLLRLHELGDQLITAVAVTREHYHYILYLQAQALTPVAAVVIHD